MRNKRKLFYLNSLDLKDLGMLNNQVKIYAGVDPGYTGGLSIILGNSGCIVYDPPVRKKDKPKKSKAVGSKEYEIQKMYELLAPFSQYNVSFAIEEAYPRRKEGSVSAFHSGEGFGFWQMAAVACGFSMTVIKPTEWKKDFPEINDCQEVKEYKEQIAALKAQSKLLKDKAMKDNISKEIKTLNGKLKREAKSSARRVAAKLYPDIADYFDLVKHDGRAESLLIATYAKNHGL